MHGCVVACADMGKEMGLSEGGVVATYVWRSVDKGKNDMVVGCTVRAEAVKLLCFVRASRVPVVLWRIY